ncbi:MAG: hypothetical protein IPK67_05835 [Planctomycetes bacterium]|nr:hypothetical protein [Planctomycetota bacterium]
MTRFTRTALAALITLTHLATLGQGQAATQNLQQLGYVGGNTRTLVLTDLRDLLLADAEVPDFQPPSPGAEKPLEPEGDAAKIAVRAKEWQRMLNLWIEPPLDPKLDALQVLDNGTVVAQLSDADHAWLRRFLELQRRERVPVQVECTILEGAKGSLAKLVPKRAGNFLSTEERIALIAAAKRATGVHVLQAPSLRVLSRARANLDCYNEFQYVKDYSLCVVQPGARTLAVPTVDSVKDGLGITARTVFLDGGKIGLEVQFERSLVAQPIRTKTVRLDVDGGRDFEVALPEVQTQRLEFAASLADGGSVYFLGPGSAPEKELLVLGTASGVKKQ